MSGERSKVILRSGWLFVATNFLLAGINLAAGLVSGSLAITADAKHSLIDSITGFLVILSEKYLARGKADRAKVERATTVAIAVIIIATGVHVVVEAAEALAETEAPEYSVWTFLVLGVSNGIKCALAVVLKRRGREQKSEVLRASGAETLNDMMISVAVLASLVVYLAFGVNVEPYVSLVIAMIIIKIGAEFLFPHLSRHHHHPLESDADHDHCGKR